MQQSNTILSKLTRTTYRGFIYMSKREIGYCIKNSNVNGILLLQYDDALKRTAVCCKAVLRKDCVAQR